MSALFSYFSFSLSGILFLLVGYSNLVEYFETYRFLLENLKVTFPFSNDIVTLCLNVS